MFEAKKFSEIFDQMRGHASGVLTDFEPGSITRTLTEAFSYELALLYEKMRLVYLSGFVDTAEGSHLDNVVAVLGIQRGLPDFAEGRVRFTRDPGSKDITVPAGTLVATEESPDTPKKVYQTVEELVVSKDQTTGEVRIQATQRGEQMDTPAGTILILPRPVPGIKSVTNEQEVKLAGKRREADDALRRRAKNTLLAAGKATKFAIENALIQLPKVRDVKVVEDFTNPDNYGVVDIFIDHPEFKKNEDPVFLDFERVVNDVRAAGILPRIKPSPVTQIAAVFKVKPAKNDLTDKELGELEANLGESVRGYIESVTINEPLSISKMVKQLLLTEGVDSLENYRMELTPPGDNPVTTVKTFSDTADIMPPVNGRFSIETLLVVGSVKIILGETHFKVPNLSQIVQPASEHEMLGQNPAGPLGILDKSGLTDTIKLQATGLSAAQATQLQNSIVILLHPWQKPDDTLATDHYKIGYAEKVRLKWLPFNKYLDIIGAFVIEFPPGTPSAEIVDAKAHALQNLLGFFQKMPPATDKDKLITFDDMINAAKEGMPYEISVAQPDDFTATPEGGPSDPSRVNAKGVLLKTSEKARITGTFN